MQKLVILGAGCAGTMIANKLRAKLREKEWQITLIDKDNNHVYQPGLLFLPFGIYEPEEIIRPRSRYISKGIHFVVDEILKVDPKEQVVQTASNRFSYDKIIVCTGVDIMPDEIDGMEDGWYKDIFDFYTFEGAVQLTAAMKDFKAGKMVLNIAEMPIKCPVAPLEFIFLADWYFHEKGIREQVEIILVTPLSGAFTKPIASSYFSTLAESKNIHIIPDFDIIEVDNEKKQIISGQKTVVDYDLLVSIPPQGGARFLVESKIAMDDTGYIHTDKFTMKALQHDNMFVLGDVTNIPTSKAGSVAHFSAEVLMENFLSEINGEPLRAKFDGHSSCFIETGFGKGALIDFNYDFEPLPGKFPLPGIGPFTLLGESKANHWGKVLFKWAYWNKLITGEDLPFASGMSLAGKDSKVGA